MMLHAKVPRQMVQVVLEIFLKVLSIFEHGLGTSDHLTTIIFFHSMLTSYHIYYHTALLFFVMML